MRRWMFTLAMCAVGCSGVGSGLADGGANDAANADDDGGVDGALDAGHADVVVDAVATDVETCALKPSSSVTTYDACEIVAEPSCTTACAIGGKPADVGYLCHSGDTIDPTLAADCFDNPIDAGAMTRSYCCARARCVRFIPQDTQCTLSGSPYAWSCPAGPVTIGDAGGATHCTAASCGSGPCYACCDIAN